MEAYTAIAIDDDIAALRRMEEVISYVPNVQLVATFGTLPEALSFMRAQPVDIVFCDVDLPGLTGVEGASFLKSRCQLLVYVTGYPERLIETITVWPHGHVIKPIKTVDVQEAVRKLEERLGLATDDSVVWLKLRFGKLLVYDGGNRDYLPVLPKDLALLVHEKNYVDVHIKSPEHTEIERIVTIRCTIKEAMAVLHPIGLFIQINPSTIINVEHITKATPDMVIINKKTYTVTDQYMDAYDTFLKRYQLGKGNKLK